MTRAQRKTPAPVSLADREAAALEEIERHMRWRMEPDGYGPRTLLQIAARLDLSKERIRQVEAVALGKLRQHTNPDWAPRTEGGAA